MNLEDEAKKELSVDDLAEEFKSSGVSAEDIDDFFCLDKVFEK